MIYVEEDTTPGPLTVITNPFHIVKVDRLRVPVYWLHEAP